MRIMISIESKSRPVDGVMKGWFGGGGRKLSGG